MDILIAANAFFPDEPRGSARVPWELAKRLAARGHRVQFLARAPRGRPPKETRDRVDVLRYSWSKLDPLGSLWTLRRALRSIIFPLDAVHVHGAAADAALRAFGGLRKPTLYFFHAPWGADYLIRRKFGFFMPLVHYPGAWLRHFMERRALAGAASVLTLSQFMTHQLRLRHGPLADKAVRIHGAADTERFQPRKTPAEARAALRWPAEKTILLTVRNLEARMGLENLLAAVAALRKKYASLQLYIVGAGPLRRFLERRVRKLELGGAVSFLGVVHDDTLALCYQAADVFVLPTRELEGFGLATVEALASGCPVVGTQVGGTAELLKPLDPDLLAPENTPKEIAAALERFLARRKEWPALREKCAKYARQKFSWDKLTAEIEKMTAALKFLPLILALFAAPGRAEDTVRQRQCLLHVHSFISPNGKTSLQAIASLASKKDVDVLIPTDRFLERWEYGLPPLPGLLRFSLYRSCVRKFGEKSYLAILDKLAKEHPGLAVVPGLEVSPAVHWTGHPAKGNLVLNEAERHLLVIGLRDAEKIRALPVLSNPGAGRLRWRAFLLPFLVTAAGLALAVRWPAGLLLAFLGAAWWVNQRPFREVSAAHSRFTRNGWDAAQALIDHVDALGGLTVWAHPESAQWKEPRRFYRSVRMATQPYPEALLETKNYTGFAYFWAGGGAAGGAGGAWDQALADYAAGGRPRPAWAFAETENPEEGRFDPQLDRSRNVLWSTEGDPLPEFRAGRFYAAVRQPGHPLVLQTWALDEAGTRVPSGGEAAWSPGLRLALDARGSGRLDVEVIRNGAVWKTFSAKDKSSVSLPLPAPEGRMDFYRLLVRSEGGSRIAANPVFVRKI